MPDKSLSCILVLVVILASSVCIIGVLHYFTRSSFDCWVVCTTQQAPIYQKGTLSSKPALIDRMCLFLHVDTAWLLSLVGEESITQEASELIVRW